jgi:hypothetical protein
VRQHQPQQRDNEMSNQMIFNSVPEHWPVLESVARICKNAVSVSPSPWGEGRDEGER